MNPSEIIEIPTVHSDGRGPSQFTTRTIELHGQAQRRLSEQLSAVNFRLRTSDCSYSSDYHVAGDPTLLILLAGQLTIELRNGQTKAFTIGDMFIAQDYLATGIEFDPSIHGHRAEVIGNEALKVLHLKLEKR